MRYYEDPVSGSIYSFAELERMLYGSDIELDALLRRMKALPPSTCCLLEEAESIAVQREWNRRQRWSSG